MFNFTFKGRLILNAPHSTGQIHKEVKADGFTHGGGGVPTLAQSLLHVAQRLQLGGGFFTLLRRILRLFTPRFLMCRAQVTFGAKYLEHMTLNAATLFILWHSVWPRDHCDDM